ADVAEVDDAALDLELAAALHRQRNVEGRSRGAGALPDRAVVDHGGGAGGAVQIEAAVALEVDRPVVGQDGVVLQVHVIPAAERDRAGVGDGPRVEERNAGDGDGGGGGDGERAAAADGAAAPSHGGGGEIDVRGAVEGAAVHRERRHGESAGI